MDQREKAILEAKYNMLFEQHLSSTLLIREIQLRTRMCESQQDPDLAKLEQKIDEAIMGITMDIVEARKKLSSLNPAQ